MNQLRFVCVILTLRKKICDWLGFDDDKIWCYSVARTYQEPLTKGSLFMKDTKILVLQLCGGVLQLS